MRITSTTNASRVQHDGTVYDADDDGIFDVPQHVGEELTAFPDWLPEYEAQAIAAAEQAERDNDVARLAARVAAIEERLAVLEGDTEPGEEPAADAPPRRTRTRKADQPATA